MTATQSAASTSAGPDRVEASPTENRNAARHAAHLMPSITKLRLKPYGAEAALVNISTTGVLAEGHIRLKPGNAVTVVFEGTFSPSSIEGRVVRTSVASMGKDGVLRYHLGIAFNKAIALDAIEAIALGQAPAEANAVPAEANAVPAEASEAPAEASAAPAEASAAPAPSPLAPAPAVLSNRW